MEVLMLRATAFSSILQSLWLRLRNACQALNQALRVAELDEATARAQDIEARVFHPREF
jgi:hypothetical protein